MPTLTDLFGENIEALAQRIEQGYVSVQTHPSLPLSILNYTKSAQYERVWDNVTTACRGLIYDSLTGKVIARPFPKFFNYGETDMWSPERFAGTLRPSSSSITEKMDGSLGIVYTYNGETAVATRGSFASDQALWATKCLQEDYFSQPAGVTTLVEIIYPDNRIVVDYGDKHALVLLGAIDNATGADIPLSDIDWWDGDVAPVYTQFTGLSLEQVVDTVCADDSLWANSEGVVVSWLQDNAPAVRIKIKHPRYVELHRIVTGLSNRSVWEALTTKTLDALIEAVPDEFHSWVRQTAEGLLDDYYVIYNQVRSDLWKARDATMRMDRETGYPKYTRRDLARHVTETAAYPGLCFALEDGKDISEKIWTMLKPERQTAVIIDDE